MFLQQAPEVEDRSFIGYPIHMEPRKLAQDSGLVQCFFHRRIAVAEPVLHQMNPQHRHQRIRRTTTFHLSDNGARSTQSDPSRARPDPSRSGNARGRVCLRLLAYSASEGHLFHRGSTVVFGSGGYFTKSESLF